MSCDFDLHCLDCDAGCGFDDLNWGQEKLVAIMKYRSQLEIPGLFTDEKAYWWWEDCGRLSKTVRFFTHHVGHRVAVLSEYGQIYGHGGECNQGNTGDGFCGLKPGHEGIHRYLPCGERDAAGVMKFGTELREGRK